MLRGFCYAGLTGGREHDSFFASDSNLLKGHGTFYSTTTFYERGGNAMKELDSKYR